MLAVLVVAVALMLTTFVVAFLLLGVGFSLKAFCALLAVWLGALTAFVIAATFGILAALGS